MDIVWAYVRVSTRKEEQEDSLEEQLRRAVNFASERGYDLRTFQEQASAKTIAGRPILTALLRELEDLTARQRPKVLFVTALDRLSRDIVESMYIGRTLRTLKVSLFVLGRGEVKLDTFSERALFVGESLGGDAENEAKSKRARDSWDRRRREGKPTSNKHPYGLQLIGERDALIPDSAAWVLQAFEWYDSGVGSHVIGNRFREGAPVHTWLTSRVGEDGERIRKTRLTRWESLRIIKLLRLRRYRGTIVDEALFDRVQHRLDTKPKSGSRRVREYPLSGAMVCSACGRRLHGRSTGASKTKRLANGTMKRYESSRIRYYSCQVCVYSVNAERIELEFFESIGKLVASEELLESWLRAPRVAASELKALKAEAKRISLELEPAHTQKSRDRIFDLAVMANVPEIEFKRQLHRLDEEERRKRERYQQISAKISGEESGARSIAHANALLRNFKPVYDKAEYDEKRLLIEALVEALGGLTVSPQGLSWSDRSAQLRRQRQSRRSGKSRV